MEQIILGQIIPEGVQAERDAIHIAVVPCICGDNRLRPGANVKLAYGTSDIILSADYNENESIGVIDPFINDWSLNKGQRVYVFLKPGSITGLRHQWTHPLFDNPPKPVNEAEAWLRNFAQEWNFDYNEMIAIATNPHHRSDYPDGVNYPYDYIIARGTDLHGPGELGDDLRLFWENIETLTGQKFGESHRNDVGWSCTC